VTTPPGDPTRPPLAQHELDRALLGSQLWREIRVVEDTGSTNADVAAAAAGGTDGAGLVVLAEYQHSGRGRLDRSWSVPPRAGLTFSVLLHTDGLPPQHWGWISLAAGLAVATAVSAAAGVDASVKWPNDVLDARTGRKLAGILAEQVGTPSGPAVVVGVGLNVTVLEAELPVPSATSLLLCGGTTTDRAPILVAVLGELERWYTAWRAAGGDADASGLRQAYVERCVTLGRRVSAALPDGTTVQGVARSVSADGALILVTESGARAIAAGDVVHLR
jgi:BirA family biotin operon repressor/biotin-[acetyl-CoA-carboxylase] ligase